MHRHERVFIDLLRAGMWETAVQLPEDFDQWDKVASLAKGQSVMGVIGKQMMTVPQISQSLSPEMRLKVKQLTFSYMHSHTLLNKTLVNVVNALRENGIESVVLKGQAIARNYPQPDLRQCGDIDLYVGCENSVKTYETLAPLAVSIEDKSLAEHGKHYDVVMERGVKVEHYINSSGLAEMIEGTAIAKEFKRIFACSFIYNMEGEAEWPGVAVDYTAKTQFIFKINKGILSVRDNKKVNESQEEVNKRIPFPHMIYFGDGETDVPCMKIVKMFGGNSIAVYNPDIKKKVNVAKKLLRQKRVNFITPADYRKDSRTYQIVCTIIDKIKAEFELAKLAKGK